MLVNTKTDGMKYEVTGNKAVNGKRASVKIASQLSTSALIWILVKRHKVGLLAIGNVILVLNFVFPEWTQFALSLIGK